jgi:transposase
VAAPKRVLTPRNAAWAVLRRPERKGAEDRALPAELREHLCVLDEAIGLAKEFAALVRGREPERLDPWLQRAQDGAVALLRRFARRLSADYDAVRAAVTLDWSNGPIEGQISRLKMMKRTLYGRVGLDLDLARPQASACGTIIKSCQEPVLWGGPGLSTICS